MLYPITPCPKPRMTQQDKWLGKPGRKAMRPAVARYWAFKDEVRYRIKGVELHGASVLFYLPMPQSWSKKKRAEMCGEWHFQRPDLSNLLKALEDAMYGEDSHIALYGRLEKRWAEEGAILIEPADIAGDMSTESIAAVMGDSSGKNAL